MDHYLSACNPCGFAVAELTDAVDQVGEGLAKRLNPAAGGMTLRSVEFVVYGAGESPT
jgi:hypothetical protein